MKTKTVFDREFESYFRTFYGYLYSAFILLVAGIYVSVNSFKNGSSCFELSVSQMTFIYLIAIPILTMRVFAEERRQRTEQLLYALPVKMGEVVLGKYLALCAVVLLPVLVMAFYPLVLSVFGDVDFLAAYCALIGFFLLGCALAAIGMFLSSLTDNQAVAAGGTFIAVLLLFFLSTLTQLLPSDLGGLTAFFRTVSPFDRYYPFLSGTLDLQAVLYLILFSAFFCLLTVMAMESRRKENVRLFYSISAILCLIILMLTDRVIGNIPESMTQIPMNGIGITDFTNETKDLVSGLDQDVTLYWIVRDGKEDSYIKDTLSTFSNLSEHIHVEKVDPVQQPGFIYRYTSSTANENSLVVECGSRNKFIDYTDLYVTPDPDNSYRSDFYGESAISSAIDYVTKDAEASKVYMLTGKGDEELSSTFTEGLKAQNISLSDWDIVASNKVPDDCACLLVSGTTQDLTAEEAGQIRIYLDGGGKLLLFSTYLDASTPNWNSVIGLFGLQAQQGIVIEGNLNNMVSGFPYYLLPNYIEHPITTALSQSGSRVIVPLTQSVSVPESLPEGITLNPLLVTSDAAYAKADGFNMKTTDKEDGDLTGKFIVAVEAEKESDSVCSGIIWFPTSYFLSDSVNTSVSGGNLRMLVTCVNYLLEQENTITALPKHIGGSTLVLQSGLATTLTLVFIAVIPLIFCLTGAVTVTRRKHR